MVPGHCSFGSVLGLGIGIGSGKMCWNLGITMDDVCHANAEHYILDAARPYALATNTTQI